MMGLCDFMSWSFAFTILCIEGCRAFNKESLMIVQDKADQRIDIIVSMEKIMAER